MQKCIYGIFSDLLCFLAVQSALTLALDEAIMLLVSMCVV